MCQSETFKNFSQMAVALQKAVVQRQVQPPLLAVGWDALLALLFYKTTKT